MNHWQLLGLDAPTDDIRAIKRAYATVLKSFFVEDDPQRFLQLRAAYEMAMAQAATPDSVEVSTASVGVLKQGAEPSPPPVSVLVVPLPETDYDPALLFQQLCVVVRAARVEGEPEAATQALASFLNTALPALDSREPFEAWLLRERLGNATAYQDVLLPLANALGWEDHRHPLWRTQPQAMQSLGDQLEALRWWQRISQHKDSLLYEAAQILKEPLDAERFAQLSGRTALRDTMAMLLMPRRSRVAAPKALHRYLFDLESVSWWLDRIRDELPPPKRRRRGGGLGIGVWLLLISMGIRLMQLMLSEPQLALSFGLAIMAVVLAVLALRKGWQERQFLARLLKQAYRISLKTVSTLPTGPLAKPLAKLTLYWWPATTLMLPAPARIWVYGAGSVLLVLRFGRPGLVSLLVTGIPVGIWMLMAPGQSAIYALHPLLTMLWEFCMEKLVAFSEQVPPMSRAEQWHALLVKTLFPWMLLTGILMGLIALVQWRLHSAS